MQNPNPNPIKNSTPTNNKSPQDPPSDDESSIVTNPTTFQGAESMEEEEVTKTALEVKDVYPHCHRCKHVFPTWAALMKHYREHYICCHPNGYSAPPGFSPLPSTSTTIPPQPDQYEDDDESLPIEIEESSDVASESDEGKGLGST